MDYELKRRAKVDRKLKRQKEDSRFAKREIEELLLEEEEEKTNENILSVDNATDS